MNALFGMELHLNLQLNMTLIASVSQTKRYVLNVMTLFILIQLENAYQLLLDVENFKIIHVYNACQDTILILKVTVINYQKTAPKLT